VRNDTGVFEGGEISMFYDPMIAKLCTWGADRATALEAMRVALDSFEVEGIGHNLPFLSAVMDHPRFISGEITTAFIAEEYPEGFDGVALSDDDARRVAAAAAAMHRVAEIRRTRVTGRMDNHERRVGTDWVVSVQGAELRGAYRRRSRWLDRDLRRRRGDAGDVGLDPGRQPRQLMIDGAPLVLKVARSPAASGSGRGGRT
jgi:propionyl-CoA carboxylase alpha chain